MVDFPMVSVEDSGRVIVTLVLNDFVTAESVRGWLLLVPRSICPNLPEEIVAGMTHITFTLQHNDEGRVPVVLGGENGITVKYENDTTLFFPRNRPPHIVNDTS